MQSKTDSAIEAISNIFVGFMVSWAVLAFIVRPIWNLPTDGVQDFLITCVFTITSLARQYIIRRLFNGRDIGRAIVQARRKTIRRKSVAESINPLDI